MTCGDQVGTKNGVATVISKGAAGLRLIYNMTLAMLRYISAIFNALYATFCT